MLDHSRRIALGAGLLTLAAAGQVVNPVRAFASAAPQPPLRAIVTIGGVTYEYREEQGSNLGDFTSVIGGFTQACIRTRAAGCDLTVFFRPDRGSDRVEVVFELCGLFNARPVNLPAYVVTIFRGAAVLATVDVPAHYWFSRWRWQSRVRPLTGDIDDLITRGLLPPYDRETALAVVSTVPPTNAPPNCAPTLPMPSVPAAPSHYRVMGLAGVVAYMPQGGERGDIGLLTETQAEFICTAREAALDLMRAQGEAAGTIPWHMRDEVSGAPMDLRRYPAATWYSSTTAGMPYVKTAATPITVDSAHQPALAYLPYLLTGDPYHLEDLQFQATWNLGSLVPQYRMSLPRPATFAWNLRTLAQCARMTPSDVPAWLLPQSYWAGFLTEYRQCFEKDYVDSRSPERARFRATRNIDTTAGEGASAPAGSWIDPWEDEFVAAVLGWVVAMGFPEWQRAFDWKIGSNIARTNKIGPWKRAQATPYRLILRESARAPIAANWAEAWALQQRIGKTTYQDENVWVPFDMTALTYTRGVLVYIDRLKAWNVSENLTWATSQLKARKWNTDYKWLLGKGLI